MYFFCTYEFLINNIENQNTYLKTFHDFIKSLKDDRKNEIRNDIWKYFINNKIDIEQTQINNNDNVINNGFGMNGFICQLFSIFKNSDIFCIKEHREENCQICNNIKIYQHNLHNHFIIIDEQGLSLKCIEDNLNVSLVYDGLMICEKCNFGQTYPTSRIYYYIDQYPSFLFILFDSGSYMQLLSNKKNIIKLSENELKFSDSIIYNLSGVILSPKTNHFTFCINSLNNHVNSLTNNILENNNFYYYDDQNNNGVILKINNVNDLFNRDKFLIF